MTQTEPKPRSIKWTELVSAFTAVAAIILSVLSLRQSAASANVARTAEAHNATQDAAGLIANVETRYYFARSTDFRALEDLNWLNPIELHPSPIPTGYWLAESRQHVASAKRGYLFLVFINQGPGRVKQLSLSNMEWIPKPGSQQPAGIEVEGALGLLRLQHFYGLLIDVLDPPNPTAPWRTTNFDLAGVHYQRVTLDLSYTDDLGGSHQEKVNMGQALQAGAPTPPPMIDVLPPGP